MTDETNADIARLREIAEEGRRLPLLGGRQTILWGSAILLATVLHGAITARLLPLPAMAIALVWFSAMVVAAVLSHTRLTIGDAQMTGIDLGNRLQRAVWQIGGSFLGLTAFAIFTFAMFRLETESSASGFALFALMPALTFGVYAIALRVAAEASGLDRLKPFALLSLGFGAVSILLAGSLLQFVATAIGIVIVAIIPGRIMLALEQPAQRA